MSVHGGVHGEPGPFPSRIDPRIRARRIEVHRSHGRRRLRRLVDVAVVALVGAGFAVALRTPLLDVDRVTVEGATRTGGDVVAAAAGIEPGDQLVDIGVGAAAARVSALAWVDEARVERHLDGVVRVAVTERVPVAVVVAPDRSDAVLVDAEGRVLAAADEWGELAGTLPRLDLGTAAVAPGRFLPERTRPVLALAGALNEAVPGVVTGLGVREGEAWARLAPGTASPAGGEVRFGPLERLPEARVPDVVLALRTVLEEVDLACLAVLDLRLPGTPVLTREDPCP